MWPQVIAAVASSYAASRGSGGSGSGEEGAMQMQQSSSDAQMRSAMQGPSVPMNAPAPVQVDGSAADDYMGEFMDAAFKKGMSAVLGRVDPAKSAKDLGADNRAYLDSAFPELNAWEKAGASATQAGVQSGQIAQQKEMQEKQFIQQSRMQGREIQARKDIAKIQADTQVNVAGISSGASIEGAKIGITPQMLKLNSVLKNMDAEYKRILSNTELNKQQALKVIEEKYGQQLRNVVTSIEPLNLQADIYNKLNTRSPVFKLLKDAGKFADDATSSFKGFFDFGDSGKSDGLKSVIDSIRSSDSKEYLKNRIRQDSKH